MTAQDKQLRLFIAATVPDVFRDDLLQAQQQFRAGSSRISLTKTENLHLTLCFIGSVSQTQAGLLREQFRALHTNKPRPFRSQLERYGCFNGRDGLTIWAGLKVAPALEAWVDHLRNELRTMGFSIENRPWLAHVTLARRAVLKTNRNDLLINCPIKPTIAMIDTISLYQSEFTEEGMVYTVLESLKL